MKNAVASKSESRDRKHFKISLAHKAALETC